MSLRSTTHRSRSVVDLTNPIELRLEKAKYGGTLCTIYHGTEFLLYVWTNNDTLIEDIPNIVLGDGGAWLLVAGSEIGLGDVFGPATSADTSVVRFNGTDNKTIEDSKTTIADDGSMVITADYTNNSNDTTAGLTVDVNEVGTNTGVISAIRADARNVASGTVEVFYGRGGNVDIRRDEALNVNIGSYASGDGGCAHFYFYRAKGTETFPAAVDADTMLGKVHFYGYEETSTAHSEGAKIEVKATEAWDGSKQGTSISIFITPTGTPDLTETVTIDGDGVGILSGAMNIPTGETYNINGVAHSHNIFDFSVGLGSDHSYNGVTDLVTVDQNTVGFGGALKLSSDGNYDDADYNATGTMPCMALALVAGTGASKLVLLMGMIRDDTWNWTPGGAVYVSTSGALSQTAPSGAGDFVQIVGIAKTADILFFNPSYVMVERV